MGSTEGIKWIVGVMFLLILAIGFFFGIGDRSTGVRQGELIKLSEKGWIWQTWEAELSMGAIQGSSGSMSPYVFDFSVCDRSQAKIDLLNDAIGKQVKITYISPMLYFQWDQKSAYCVTDIQIIK
jgi:hypothetical protein